MRTQSQLLRDQAARFLALSTQAREAGDSALADLFAEAAADCLGKIVAAEQAEAAPPAATARQPEPAEQPQQQQQQQQQPPHDDKEC